mmetsp:Transcript_9912/g.31850  ORF Transcript_9912/g.31850 Transcript_9912/m.31850 type:complete len:113 (+) Transcript_9912:1267-1605(+)
MAHARRLRKGCVRAWAEKAIGHEEVSVTVDDVKTRSRDAVRRSAGALGPAAAITLETVRTKPLLTPLRRAGDLLHLGSPPARQMVNFETVLATSGVLRFIAIRPTALSALVR